MENPLKCCLNNNIDGNKNSLCNSEKICTALYFSLDCGNSEVRKEFNEKTDITGMVFFSPDIMGALCFNLHGLLDHISLAVVVKVHRTDTQRQLLRQNSPVADAGFTKSALNCWLPIINVLLVTILLLLSQY